MTDEPSTPTPLGPEHKKALRIRSLQLIALGYKRMTPTNFSSTQEDAITGELAREMKEVMEEDEAPGWMQNYSANEQVRAHVPGLLGIQRPIVDVEFVRNQRGRRPRLRFEAKRLGPNHPASGYFGSGGLEAFVTGYYDRTHEDAGMLGYVQSGDAKTWTDRLETKCANRPTLCISANWSQHPGARFPKHTFHTGHTDAKGGHMDVFHVLLDFQ